MKYPTVTPTSVRPNRSNPGAYIVTITCPYCHREHTHGLPVGDAEAGHRHSHCGQGNGYFITAEKADR